MSQGGSSWLGPYASPSMYAPHRIRRDEEGGGGAGEGAGLMLHGPPRAAGTTTVRAARSVAPRRARPSGSPGDVRRRIARGRSTRGHPRSGRAPGGGPRRGHRQRAGRPCSRRGVGGFATSTRTRAPGRACGTVTDRRTRPPRRAWPGASAPRTDPWPAEAVHRCGGCGRRHGGFDGPAGRSEADRGRNRDRDAAVRGIRSIAQPLGHQSVRHNLCTLVSAAGAARLDQQRGAYDGTRGDHGAGIGEAGRVEK